MRKTQQRLWGLVENVVAPMGYEFVGIEFSRGEKNCGLLRVYIDVPEGISLDDCAVVSHQLSGVLAVEDPIAGDYRLEVSSPGLDRPLFEMAHFKRFIGREVKLRLASVVDGRRRYRGVIAGVEGKQVHLSVEGQTVVVDFDQIESANLIPDL